MQDLGTACLMKGLQMATTAIAWTSNNPALSSTTTQPSFSQSFVSIKPTTINRSRSRYFAVKPMMFEQRKINPYGFKSPAFNARKLYSTKGYPSAIPMQVRVTNDNVAKVSVNNVQSRDNSPQSQNSYVFYSGQQNPFQINWFPEKQYQNGKLNEDIQLLNGLKSSLGMLNAQAMNLKQRTQLLYTEARRKRLKFFDGLLRHTNRIIDDKQYETKRSIEEIDNVLDRLQQQQHFDVFQKFQQQFSGLPVFRYPNGMRRPQRKIEPINQKQIDQLLSIGLRNAQEMMRTVKHLNEAFDEFEDQFNFPRFEPNRIEDDSMNEIF
ncbi:hypothetical protein QR98_0060660 [Sarcoptes scabiei]|nr:hypothetical protein QR98_0060660 [Sarcoptes scabiei]